MKKINTVLNADQRFRTWELKKYFNNQFASEEDEESSSNESFEGEKRKKKKDSVLDDLIDGEDDFFKQARSDFEDELI